MLEQKLLERFISITGAKNALTHKDNLDRYTHENRDLVVGKTPLVLKPGSTQEVSDIVKLAAQTRTVLVPQGGHTGHAGGGVPDESGSQIVVSLERMNKIREVDLDGNVIVCEAGTILETLQTLAGENDRLFPLSLGSQGSCQIGGNISTNAGGTGVLAYGNTRQLVMGLEVVLPSGEIWNGLRRLKKDNTGYDLKELFIGAEGTLGIITAAVVKLFPKSRGQAIALCGLQTPEKALSLLNQASSVAGHQLTTFELMAKTPMEFTFKHSQNVRNPLTQVYPWHVMIEISSNRSQEDADTSLQSILADALETELIADAAVSSSLSQFQDIWRIREEMPPAQKREGTSIKHDISVPVHCLPEFLKRADEIVARELPAARVCCFGHMGDGNMHYNISQAIGDDPQAFLDGRGHINDLIHALVLKLDGSVSAEHGVGRFKRDLIARTKDPVELEMMRNIKRTLDPHNIMNPDKVVVV